MPEENLIDKIARYYKPFDTVGSLNKSIKSKPLKNIVNLCLFVGGSLFFTFSAFTLYSVYTTGFALSIDIRYYLLALVLMFLTDAVAVVVEGIDIKAHVEEKEKIKWSDIISISLSFIIGSITAYMIYVRWIDYYAGITHIEPDLILIAIMKMILAAVTVLRSGELLVEEFALFVKK
jgi:hypothetical protein